MSLQKKFLFIHVPKTGGNSLQSILKKYSEDTIKQLNDERFEVVNSINKDLPKHTTLARYKSVLDKDVYKNLFKFAVIRNPWDKLMSWYFSPHIGHREWNRDKFIEIIKYVSPLRHYICINNKHGLSDDIDFLISFENLNDDFKYVSELLNIEYDQPKKINSSKHVHYSHYYDNELKDMVYWKFKEEIEYGNYKFEGV